jgi:hypothetical protein
MKEVRSDWFDRYYSHYELDDLLRGLPLLYVHNLRDGLERRIIKRLGGDVAAWESDMNDIGNLDESSPLCHVDQVWLRNWKLIHTYCSYLDAEEVRQLTGRAA